MRITILSLLALLLITHVKGQKIYEVKEINWDSDQPEPVISSDTTPSKYYTISLVGNTGYLSLYPFKSEQIKEIDTLSAIQELLRFRGDTRICGLPVRMAFNPLKSSGYYGKKFYSIQVQALYLINQLLYDRHTPLKEWVPVLVDAKIKRDITYDEEGITRLYDAYIEWFDNVKHLTLNKIRELPITQHETAGVYWHF